LIYYVSVVVLTAKAAVSVSADALMHCFTSL
jgi:hypothetical protein